MIPSLLGLFLAGLLTFGSPCVLPLIPAYLAALGGNASRTSRGRLVASASAFSVGMSVVFVALGAFASVLGARLLAHRTALMIASGALMVLFGLRTLGAFRIPLLDREGRPALARVQLGGGLGSAMLFGAAFALGWSPCIGPILASALAYAASHTASPWRGAGLLSVYALGVSLPLVVVAAVAERALEWLRRSRSLIPILERATGALLVVVGLVSLGDAGRAFLPSKSSSERPCAAPASHGCGLPEATNDDGPTTGGEGERIDISGPRLVEFVAKECSVCRRMAPVLAEAEASCAGVGPRTVRVDVGTRGGRHLAEKFRVMGTPTFVFLGDDGVEQARLLGEQPASELELAIQATFGLRCEAPSERPSSG